MRRAISSFITSICCGTALLAQNPEQIFEDGNRLYQEKRFSEARDAYESLLNNGYASGDLYYNLGNAHYKLGDIAQAILNYERAMRLKPNDEDLRHNLTLANLMLADKIEPTPRLFVWDYWDGVKGAFSVESVIWMTYGVFVLCIGSFCIVVISRSHQTQKTAMVGGTGTALVFVVLLLVCLARISDLGRDDIAVVTQDIITIKNSPDVKSSDAFILHSGVKVQVTDRVGGWIKIQLADGKVGWMKNGGAERI
jgi:tetratricopeptide (TPR) repeat protein